MTRSRALIILSLFAAVAVGLVAGAGPAGAHPLGNFTVNRHIGVLVSPDAVDVDYLVDLAEIPTTQLGAAIEADAAGYCAEQAAGVELVVGGSAVALSVSTASVERFPGEAGLSTLRVECGLTAPVEVASTGSTIAVADRNDEDRIGWREIVVVGDGVIVDGDVRSDSPSARLTDYDVDSLGAAPRDTTAEFTATASVNAAAASLERVSQGRASFGTDAFGSLFANAGSGLAATAVALLVAALLGSLHAMAPGHGKAVIGAYLIGTRGTRRQALGLAVAVALSHTLGVLVLGGLTLLAGSAWSPEQVFPWLQAISAVIVLGIGIWLTLTWWRGRAGDHDHDRPHDHDHGHDHDHPHDHGHGHGHGHDHEHDHELVGAAVGHQHGPDHHGPDHHGPDHGGDRRRSFEVHRHGIFPHVHRHDIDRVALDGSVSWKTLALLGLSGGLVPSTSAIIVLLGAVQIGRIAFGGALILAFGVGMSLALVGVGLGVVALSNRAVGVLGEGQLAQRIRSFVVPLAAVAVLTIGALLTVRAAVNL